MSPDVASAGTEHNIISLQNTIIIYGTLNIMMLLRLIVALIVAKFTYEQYTTINQSTAGCFDPRVLVNCLQVTYTYISSYDVKYTYVSS